MSAVLIYFNFSIRFNNLFFVTLRAPPLGGLQEGVAAYPKEKP